MIRAPRLELCGRAGSTGRSRAPAGSRPAPGRRRQEDRLVPREDAARHVEQLDGHAARRREPQVEQQPAAPGERVREGARSTIATAELVA